MAILSPSLEVIKNQKVQPTEGEWALLNFLLQNLDDTYEIYVQPYLNGDNPDFVIMRRNSGVLIIEVKDWRLDNYYIDESTNWYLQKNSAHIKSPLKQVDSYKENLFKLHIKELYKKNIINRNHWATVNCAVYFHNALENNINSFILDDFNDPKYNRYNKFVSYIAILGKDSLTSTKLNSTLSRYWLNRQSIYFDDILYHSFQRYLQPPIHQLEEGIPINYSKEQQELIRSETRPRRKIKGVAGSGKTLVLAKRAVNAHIRTNNKVLILTYNLSLKNYIHDRISDVREKFYWNNFYITNYHQFFKAQANNYNLEIYGLSAWNDVMFFDEVKTIINKFDVVLIDEIQDYQQEWIDIITKYFTHPETEFVVFGDEKQNIYERELDENNEPIVRTIPGTWNKSLNTSHRFASNIGNIAMKFQKFFFGKKYNIDELNFLSKIDFEERVIEYHYFESHTAEYLFNIVYSIIEKHKIHSSNVGILCSKVELLRDIDFLIRTIKNENTSTTFETKEEFENIKEEETIRLKEKGIREDLFYKMLNIAIHDRLEDIRKIKKNHFWMQTGTVKLSTIHSFKGWEIDTLFLFIENEDDNKEFTNAEIVYTGLTRARKNLIIFNLGNLTYDAFFKNVVDAK